MTETPIDDRAVIGDSPRRREDARFVTGHGQYLDDLHFANVVHAVFLRSPHAHARIVAIDTAEASRATCVVAILTAKDAAADGLLPLCPTVEANVQTDEPFRQGNRVNEYVTNGSSAESMRVLDSRSGGRPWTIRHQMTALFLRQRRF